MMYSLTDFTDISNKGFHVILPNETVTLINELSHLVGSPNYIKTPVFTKRVTTSDIDKKRRRQRNRVVDTSETWTSGTNANIVFNPTSSLIKKNEDGVTTPIQLIRPLLNKFGSNTVNQHIKEELLSVFGNIFESDITQEELSKLLNQVFDIISSNLFYSSAYAGLYSELLTKHSIFVETLDNQLSKYISTYSDISSVDPKEDYDAFCSMNKKNDRREAVTSFYVNLYKLNNISQYNMLNITKKVVCMIQENIYDSKSEQLITELIKNIFILLDPSSDLFSSCNDIMMEPSKDTEEDEDTMSIREYIIQLSGSAQKTYPGLNTKGLFKLKDLIDSHKKV